MSDSVIPRKVKTKKGISIFKNFLRQCLQMLFNINAGIRYLVDQYLEYYISVSLHLPDR